MSSFDKVQIRFYSTNGPFAAVGQPVEAVAEYSEVTVAIEYAGPPLPLVYLYVGGVLMAEPFELRPNMRPFSHPVEDYVGVLRWELRQQEQLVAAAELTVLPGKLTAADVDYIKERRIPTLLAQLHARNAIRLRYDDDSDRLYHFYSLDYSIERLLHFSMRLLDAPVNHASLAERIYNRLAYRSEAEELRVVGSMRGTVRWATTATRWANRPADLALVHECRREVKDYATPLNRVLMTLQRELAMQLRTLAAQLARREPASAMVGLMLTRAAQHEAWRHRRLLAAIATLPIPSLPEAVRQLRSVANPAYRELLQLWREFLTRYVTLDPAAHLSSLQPMHKIYELWCVCETAAALGLREASLDFGRGATFSGTYMGQPAQLLYDQPTAVGWLSSRRAVNIRPDIVLEIGGKRLLLDVKYRIGDNRARTDDLLKMLAYMNDLRVPTGGIIYPGNGTLVAHPDSASQQVAYELPLRPNLADPGALTATLRRQLDAMIAGV